MSDDSRFRITGAGTGPRTHSVQTVEAACAAPSCPAGRERTEHFILGETPEGTLVCCSACGYEHIETSSDSEVEAAQREAQVAARGAEQAVALTVGPLSTGALIRLRHPDQVTAMTRAAEHATGTPEAVVLYLRAQGYELVHTDPVLCTCPDGIRSPVCELHGDVDEPEPSGERWP